MRGIGGAIGSTLTQGIAFQDTMNTLGAVTGASATQMAALSQRAIDLGADLSLPNTSAADAATAMTELAKAGLSVKDSMDAAKGVLQLAAAAGVSEGEAALYAAAALNAFHLPGREANRIADLLAASANASAASIQEMGDAMRQSAAVFSAAHIPVEDLVTAIAELANAGIRGQDAGTSLKQAILQLQTPSKQQAELMKQLNFHLYDSSGRMHTLRDIIGQLEVGTKGLTQQQRDYALGVIFGSDAIRIANVLISEGTAGFDKMKTAVTQAGVAQDVAGAKAKGLGGAIRGLQSEWETLQLIIFLKVQPALEAVVRFAAEKLPGVQTMVLGWIDVLGHWADSIAQPIQNAIDKIGELTRVIQVKPLVPNKAPLPTEGLTPGIGESPVPLGSSQAEQMGSQFAEALIKQAGRIANAFIQALRTAFDGVDWFGFGEQVGRQAVPFGVGFTNTFFEGVFTVIKEHPFESFLAVLTIAFTPAKLARPVFEAIGKIPVIGGLLAPVLESFNALGNRLAGRFIGGLLERLALGEGEWATGLGRLIGFVGDLPGRALQVGEQIATSLGRGLGAALEPVVNVVRVFVRQVDEILTYLVTRTPQIAREAFGGFRAQLGIWAEQALLGARLLVDDLIATIGRLVEPFTTLAGRAMGGLRDVIVTVGEAIRGFFVSLWDAIWSFLVARWNSILASAGERFGAIRDAVATRGSEIWANVTGLWDQIWGWLTARWSSILSTAWDRWGAIRDTIVNWVTNARDRVGQLWEDMVGAAGGAGNRIWGAIKGGLNSAISVLNTFSHGINKALSTFGVPNIPDIPGLARGGVMEAGSGGGRVAGITAIVGEGSGPEYVIPTEPRYRDRALQLLHDAAKDLGLIGLAGGGILNWLPTAGAMVQGPGGSFSHAHLNAWDFMAANFSRLFAGLSGIVSQYTSASSGSGYGNSILMNLDQGGQVILAHLAQVLASGHVNAGALIGLTDNTGFSTGPHLHFEVRGSGLNPTTGGYTGGIPGLAGLVAQVDIGALVRAALSPLTSAAHVAANALSPEWVKSLANSIIDKVSNHIGSGLGGPGSPPHVDIPTPQAGVKPWAGPGTGWPTFEQGGLPEPPAGWVWGDNATLVPRQTSGPMVQAEDGSWVPASYYNQPIPRAGGGPVVPNRVYRVGERGPELFSPDASGQILPSGGRGDSLSDRLLQEAVDVLHAINRTPGLSPAAVSRRYGRA